MNRQQALITTTIALGLGLVLSGCKPSAHEDKKAPSKPEVVVTVVDKQAQALVTELPGRTVSRLVAEIRPQVSGIIQSRDFVEGSMVKAGQQLYQIDPSTYQAVYASAQASLAKAQASLVSTEAKATRYQELVAINAVSKQDNDDIQALVKQSQADIAVAKAAVDSARINVNFTRITAPISGRVETSVVTPGALVTANQTTALTTVQQLDPIYVDVTQASNDILRLKRKLESGALKRVSKDEVSISLVLEDGSSYQHEGKLKFSGVTVNQTSGAITMRAIVPNPEGLLMPGMYVRAQLEEAVNDDAILVPQQSVSRNSKGEPTVLLVDDANKVQIRTISVDGTAGSNWIVIDGLQPGERVILEGGQKVKVGDEVKPIAADAAPKPADDGKPAASAGAAPAPADSKPVAR